MTIFFLDKMRNVSARLSPLSLHGLWFLLTVLLGPDIEFIIYYSTWDSESRGSFLHRSAVQLSASRRYGGPITGPPSLPFPRYHRCNMVLGGLRRALIGTPLDVRFSGGQCQKFQFWRSGIKDCRRIFFCVCHCFWLKNDSKNDRLELVVRILVHWHIYIDVYWQI